MRNFSETARATSWKRPWKMWNKGLICLPLSICLPLEETHAQLCDVVEREGVNP